MICAWASPAKLPHACLRSYLACQGKHLQKMPYHSSWDSADGRPHQLDRGSDPSSPRKDLRAKVLSEPVNQDDNTNHEVLGRTE